MPITYQVLPEARLVVATGSGVLTDKDVFGYQREVWTRPEVGGFDELIDVSAVSSLDLPSVDRIRQLAAESAKSDDKRVASRLAIVAPQDFLYGIGRMYEVYREESKGSAKAVQVFRTLAAALSYLGVDAGFAQGSGAS